MQLLTDQLLSQVVERLVVAVQPLEIRLFGSYAAGTAGPRSDVDLLVVVPNNAPDCFELARRGYPALVDLLPAGELHFIRQQDFEQSRLVRFSLPYEATHHGKRLYAATVVSPDRAPVA